MKIICTLILLTLLSGCGQKQTVQISDVTKPETVVLKNPQDLNATWVRGISLRFHGRLDGDATISGTNILTQRFTGVFDVKMGTSWYSNTCQLQYSPGSVRSGQVMIEYVFCD